MKKIRVRIPDSVHIVLEQILYPLAPSREQDGKSKEVNTFISDSVTNSIAGIVASTGANKSDILKFILIGFKNAFIRSGGITTEEQQIIKQLARKYIKEAKTRHITKATLIPALLERICQTEDLNQFFKQLNNQGHD